MNKLVAIAALSTLLIAGPASAQVYIGAGAGESRPDHDDTSWKALIGLQVTPIFGAEVSYFDFGTEGGINFDAESAAATGTLEFAPGWALLGKVGVARVHVGSNDETNTYLGAGVRYALNPSLGLSLDYDDFGEVREANSSNQSRTTNLGLTARYLF